MSTPVPTELATWSVPSMGGSLNLAVRAAESQLGDASRDARRVARRVDAWAGRLTRFDPSSDLMRLNGSQAGSVTVRPTLAAALRWAVDAERRSEGVVQATLLDERLAAEHGNAEDRPGPLGRQWRLEPGRRAATVDRQARVRFDLDGLAKGWIADRAADLLARWPSVAVDADGDVALSAGPGDEWLVAVADPRSEPGSEPAPLATLRVRGGRSWTTRFGVATSGTSVHRWTSAAGRPAHHLIDPRTGRPAETDVIQATVVAPSAREAEMIAKSAVILGSQEALGFLDRSAALAAILLLESGAIACLPGIDSWLA